MIKPKKGDIVWAQADKEPVWPAVIIYELENGLSEVVFLNDNSRAVLRNHNIHDFLEFKAKYEKTSQKKSFKEAMVLAEQKALQRVTKKRQESTSPAQKGSTSSKKKQSLPAVRTPKKKVEIKKKPEPSVSPKAKNNSRPRKQEDSPTLTPPKRMRPKQQEVEVSEEKIRITEPTTKHSKKKIKKNLQPESKKAQKKEQSQDQHPEKKVNSAELERIKEKVTAHTVQELPLDLSTLKELRKRVDNITVKIYTINENDNTKLSQESIKELENISALLRSNNLKAEDMLVTKISNMLYFIVKTLAKKEECVAIIDRIKKELGKMKESLADKFENTVKYEKDLRDIKLERARINVDETDNWLPKFLRVDLNSD